MLIIKLLTVSLTLLDLLCILLTKILYIEAIIFQL